MNALTVSWRLKSDLLTILAAAAPQGGDRSSEKRLLSANKIRRHRSASNGAKLDLTPAGSRHEFRDDPATAQAAATRAVTPD